MKYVLMLASLIIFLTSCNSYKTKYPYSLSDFRPELREHLEKLVSKPFIHYSANEAALNYLDNHTSDKELRRLLKSEHPILRALAFKYIILRESIDIDNILLESLDDTAIISNSSGELDTYVADYIIDESQDKTSILKSALIETVITKHPYLTHSALFFLHELSGDQKYYPYLKKIIDNKYPSHYRVEEELISALSKYKKDTDTSRIVESLHNRWMHKEEHKFELIENYPSPAYFFVIERYYNRLLAFKTQKILQEEFWRDENFESTFEKFIYAAAAYKSDRAAVILGSIFNNRLYKLPLNDQKVYYPYFEHILSAAMKKYDCIYYRRLSLLVKDAAEKFDNKYSLPPMEATIDTTIFKERKTW